MLGWFIALGLTACTLHTGEPTVPLIGTWRSLAAEVTLTEQGGSILFGCADGTMTQALNPDARGQFAVPGTFTPRSSVERVDEPPPVPRAVIYTGSVTGDTLVFRAEFDDGTRGGDVTVVKDANAFVVMCA
jgi:hypothetical protein